MCGIHTDWVLKLRYLPSAFFLDVLEQCANAMPKNTGKVVSTLVFEIKVLSAPYVVKVRQWVDYGKQNTVTSPSK